MDAMHTVKIQPCFIHPYIHDNPCFNNLHKGYWSASEFRHPSEVRHLP